MSCQFFFFCARVKRNQFNIVFDKHVCELKKLLLSKIVVAEPQFYAESFFTVGLHHLFDSLYHLLRFFKRLEHPADSGSISVNIGSGTSHIYVNADSGKFYDFFCSFIHVLCRPAGELPDNFLRNRRRINIVFFKRSAIRKSARIYHLRKIFVAAAKFLYENTKSRMRNSCHWTAYQFHNIYIS